MKMTLTTNQIVSALLQDQYASWTHEGATALAEYFEQVEEDTGEELELDVVAVRCEYSEYASATDWLEETDTDTLNEIKAEIECEDKDELEDAVLEYAREHDDYVTDFAEGVIMRNS